MTPRTKRVAINLSALIGAVIAVGGWAVKSGARAIDERYVHTDSFRVVQSGAALRHQRDSLSYDAQFARIDTSLAALVRACQKRGECP